MSEQLWVCRHNKSLREDCQECNDDDSEYNDYPNGWHHIDVDELVAKEPDEFPSRYMTDYSEWLPAKFDVAAWFGPPYFIRNFGHVYDFASLEEVGRYLDQCPTKYKSFVVPREAFLSKGGTIAPPVES
jgi:hypothetical protein